MVRAERGLAQEVTGAEHGHEAGSVGGSTNCCHLKTKENYYSGANLGKMTSKNVWYVAPS